MNKKTLGFLRKQFNYGNEDVTFNRIIHVYVRPDSGVQHVESQNFGFLEAKEQILYLENIKKLLGGKLESKQFVVPFQSENTTKSILEEAVYEEGNALDEILSTFVSERIDHLRYGGDLVFTFLQGAFYAPTKSKEEDEEQSVRTNTSFIVGVVNGMQIAPDSVRFDFKDKKFETNKELDRILNLSKPLDGFVYPALTDVGTQDMRHILYSAGKSEQPSVHFVQDVLQGVHRRTEKQEKEAFESVLLQIIGEKVDMEYLLNVYNAIRTEVFMDDEPLYVKASTLQQILGNIGIDFDVTDIEDIFDDVLGDRNYAFLGHNIVLKNEGKSTKLVTRLSHVTLSPTDLKNVKSVLNNKGQKCILIEVDEDLRVGGFIINPERI